MGSGKGMEVEDNLVGSKDCKEVAGSKVVGFAGSGRFRRVSRLEAGSIVVVKMGLCAGVVAPWKMMLGLWRR